MQPRPSAVPRGIHVFHLTASGHSAEPVFPVANGYTMCRSLEDARAVQFLHLAAFLDCQRRSALRASQGRAGRSGAVSRGVPERRRVTRAQQASHRSTRWFVTPRAPGAPGPPQTPRAVLAPAALLLPATPRKNGGASQARTDAVTLTPQPLPKGLTLPQPQATGGDQAGTGPGNQSTGGLVTHGETLLSHSGFFCQEFGPRCV